MDSTVKLSNGRYEIGLPWKGDPPRLENNRSQAESRLQMLKKRLQRDAILREKYQDFMNDLLCKNYAKRLPNEDQSQKDAWYLPHHPVFHPQKPDKVRVVFDCSAQYRGTSLNDQLLQGPDLTNTLVGVLTRFRQEQVAFMSDIEAMFYQVQVRPSDCNYLRFLWWPDGNLETEPEEYQMLVHLFGGPSSPSCANYALRGQSGQKLGKIRIFFINVFLAPRVRYIYVVYGIVSVSFSFSLRVSKNETFPSLVILLLFCFHGNIIKIFRFSCLKCMFVLQNPLLSQGLTRVHSTRCPFPI